MQCAILYVTNRQGATLQADAEARAQLHWLRGRVLHLALMSTQLREGQDVASTIEQTVTAVSNEIDILAATAERTGGPEIGTDADEAGYQLAERWHAFANPTRRLAEDVAKAEAADQLTAYSFSPWLASLSHLEGTVSELADQGDIDLDTTRSQLSVVTQARDVTTSLRGAILRHQNIPVGGDRGGAAREVDVWYEIGRDALNSIIEGSFELEIEAAADPAVIEAVNNCVAKLDKLEASWRSLVAATRVLDTTQRAHGDALQRLISNVDRAIDDSNTASADRLADSQSTQVALVTGGIAATLLLLWFVSARVIRPVRVALIAVRESANDLSEAARGIEEMANALAAGAANAAESTDHVTSCAEEVGRDLTQVGASTSRMTHDITGVSAAVEQATATVTDIAGLADRGSQLANNATQLAEEGGQRVARLGEAATEIERVLETIRGIAEHTNLLALNATIEAARSGAAGRGFAVVAAEVKRLAEQAAEATEDICTRVEGIRASTTDTIDVMTEIHQVVARANEASTEIAKAVGAHREVASSISSDLVATSQAATSVAESITNSVARSRSIADSAAVVGNTVEQTTREATGARQACRVLNNLAAQLDDLVSGLRQL